MRPDNCGTRRCEQPVCGYLQNAWVAAAAPAADCMTAPYHGYGRVQNLTATCPVPEGTRTTGAGVADIEPMSKLPNRAHIKRSTGINELLPLIISIMMLLLITLYKRNVMFHSFT